MVLCRAGYPQTHYVGKDNFEFVISMPLLLKGWNYNHASHTPFLLLDFKKSVCVYVKGQFVGVSSPSTMWVLRLDLRSSGLVAES